MIYAFRALVRSDSLSPLGLAMRTPKVLSVRTTRKAGGTYCAVGFGAIRFVHTDGLGLACLSD
jgi:hypothetical protein